MCKKGLPAVWTKEKIEEALCGICRKEQKAASGKGNEASIWAADTQNI